MKPKVLKAISVIFIVISCLVCLFLAGSQEDTQGEKAIYGLKPQDYVLPPGARELKVEFAFPTQDDETKGIYLTHPQAMCASGHDSLFISDVRNNEVYEFDFSGKFLRTIGRLGQGPGEFMMPSELAILDNQLIVRDMGNMRIQIFDRIGNYKNGFKVFRNYSSLIACKGRLYVAPIFSGLPPEKGEGRLVDALDFEGRVTWSFGEMLKINSYDNAVLNRVQLALGANNEIWVSFLTFPIVRKYSLNGDLLKEYRYAYGIVAKKEAFNKKMDAESTRFSSKPYYLFNHAICATAKGLYLLVSSDKRIDILLLDQDGHISEFYWLPHDMHKYSYYSGLVVIEKDAARKFYILDMSSARTEVLSIK